MRVYHEIRKNEDGFTMIEMMVVIIIVGILVGSFASGFMIYLDQARTKQTNERLEKIKEAVNLYLELNEKLPCTASLTAEIDSAGFGKEVDATDCRNANFDGTFRDDAFNG